MHKIGTPAERNERAEELMCEVGLNHEQITRYPHEFSGRPASAHRHCPRPGTEPQPDHLRRAGVCAGRFHSGSDFEPDAGTERKHGLTYIFISHNLSVVHHLCDRIAVMYLGNVVEIADKRQLFDNPQHPYTKALLAAIPVPDPERQTMSGELEGDVPSPLHPPTGCCFHTRCKFAGPKCSAVKPPLVELEPGHQVACHPFAAPWMTTRDILPERVQNINQSKRRENHEKNKLLAFVLAAALGASMLAACGSSGSSTAAGDGASTAAGETAYKDTITIATGSDQNYMDGQMNNTNDVYLRACYSQLVRRSADNELVGDLAESWEVSGDGCTWTFHLKKGVKFHSGKELTSADVKASYDRLLDTENPVRYNSLATGYISACNVVDDYTVELVTPSPIAPFLANLTHRSNLILNADLHRTVRRGSGPDR